MSDSNITKRALASALKELMETLPFEKIRVSDICGKCGMNRKSFYYHFKDKYDLVNWIFDTEFVPLMLEAPVDLTLRETYLQLEPAMAYLYENRNFYRKAIQIQGQNSFSNHMREFMVPSLKVRLHDIFDVDVEDEFVLNFFADAAFCAIHRWLSEKDSMTADEFLVKLYEILYRSSYVVYERFQEDAEENLS